MPKINKTMDATYNIFVLGICLGAGCGSGIKV
jgi:hypothetical protein